MDFNKHESISKKHLQGKYVFWDVDGTLVIDITGIILLEPAEF